MKRTGDDYPVALVKDCPIDHDHDDSWFCDDGGAGSLHLDIIQRDIRDLTLALRARIESEEQR